MTANHLPGMGFTETSWVSN